MTTADRELEALSSDRYSRAAAAKLAIAALGSLALGVGRVSPAWAMTRDECVLQCWQKHIDAANRAVRVCADVFDDQKSFFNTPSGGWARAQAIWKRGGWGFVQDMAKHAAWEVCEATAIKRMENGFDRCEDACRETCPSPGSRSPSSREASRATCRGTPPPRVPLPSAPPPPGSDGGPQDPCGPCAKVGGKCCFGKDPNSLCVCANPDYDCKERYGCGN